MSTPVLGYWPIRGLANHIRFLLEYVGAPYEFKEWAGDSEKGWFAQKHKLGIKFPNLPYFIDGDKKISQSGAITKYLARKHGLVAKNDADQIEQDVLDGVMQDFRNMWTWFVYVSSDDFEADKPKYRAKIDPKLEELNELLGKQQYLLGDYLTYNDFVFFELLEINNAVFPDLLQQFPKLKEFHDRIRNLKGVREYLQSDRNPKKYNGPVARWGG